MFTIETGNPPSSILSALNAWASSSRSFASFCFAARWASDLKKVKKCLNDENAKKFIVYNKRNNSLKSTIKTCMWWKKQLTEWYMLYKEPEVVSSNPDSRRDNFKIQSLILHIKPEPRHLNTVITNNII